MRTAENSSTGELVRTWRIRAGLTLERLAETAGVSTRTLGNIERGVSRGPQRRSLELVADALDLSSLDRVTLDLADRSHRMAQSGVEPVQETDHRASLKDFTGRTAELEALRVAAAQAHPPVVVLTGPGGFGKTTLAMQAAQSIAVGYPDGLLLYDLRGVDDLPVQPDTAIRVLLESLGVPATTIPTDDAACFDVFHRLVARRRAVVVLDNAADAAQIAPFLRPGGRSLILVTSRRALVELDGVLRVPLEPMPTADAAALLEAIVGDGVRAADDLAQLPRLAELCGCAPLALRIAGNRLASRPRWTVAHLVERLRDVNHRLGELSAGDLRVESTIELSYRQLSDRAQLVFRRFALVPGGDADPELIRVAAGESDSALVHDALGELVEAGLFLRRSDGRFIQHDLIRLFGRARLSEEGSQRIDRQRERVTQWLLMLTISAGSMFEPDDVVAALQPAYDFETIEAAGSWLHVELDNWFLAFQDAAAHHQDRQVLDTAESLHWYSDNYNHWRGWCDVFRLSTTAAIALADVDAEATHLGYHAWALIATVNDFAAALPRAELAYDAATRAGNIGQQGWALRYEGNALSGLRRFDEAIAAMQRSAKVLSATDDLAGQIFNGPIELAYILCEAGRPQEALAHVQRARALADSEAARSFGTISSIIDTAIYGATTQCLFQLGDFTESVAAGRKAVDIAVAAESPTWLAAARRRLGRSLFALGATDEARRELLEALLVAQTAHMTVDAYSTQTLIDELFGPEASSTN